MQISKTKSQPKCLIKKDMTKVSEVKYQLGSSSDSAIDEHSKRSTSVRVSDRHESLKPKRRIRRIFKGFSDHAHAEQQCKRKLFSDRRRAEIHAMLSSYEGKTIGWLLRFLEEEMTRLQELRKLHLITIMAQRERWRREAAEAGLRQKENEMRDLFEEMFDKTDELNVIECNDYFQEIIPRDTHSYADDVATSYVTKLARQIDEDLNRWLESFKLIQTPNTFDKLRILLRDMVFPNLEQILYNNEKTQVIHHIFNDVLFPKIYKELEPYDISFAISNDLVDRLIDNDLYFFSSECQLFCDCKAVCNCPTVSREVKAILRKLVRYAVPGRRWKTSTERIAHENLLDIVDDAFDEMNLSDHETDEDDVGCLKPLEKQRSVLDLMHPEKEAGRHSVSVKSNRSSWVHDINYSQGSFHELRKVDSEYDLHHPSRYHVYSVSSLIASETFLGSIKGDDIMKSNVIDPKFCAKVVDEILKAICGEDEKSTESLSDIFADAEEEEGRYEEKGFVGMESDEIKDEFTEELRNESESLPTESFEEISQSELDRMAEDKCKCREEILKEIYIKKQILIGKIRVKKPERDEDEITNVGSFVYQSEDDVEAKKVEELQLQEEMEYDALIQEEMELNEKADDSVLDGSSDLEDIESLSESTEGDEDGEVEISDHSPKIEENVNQEQENEPEGVEPEQTTADAEMPVEAQNPIEDEQAQ